MNQTLTSNPLPISKVTVTDSFWKSKMELVRTNVIPYQWDALNDKVEGAAPSFCMHNFKAAAKLNEEKEQKGSDFQAPSFTFRGFEALPEDAKKLNDKFYGFVFQDSDFHKWIEAVAYSLSNHADPELEKIADEAIDIVCAAQQENGYLDTFYILNGQDKIFTNLRDFHELYCLGHMIEGAVAYYEATGKRKLLDATCRFADFVADYFGLEDGKCKGYPGHELAEMALVRLYQVTGNQRYLDLSTFFVNQRGVRPYYFDGEHPEDIKNALEDLRHQYFQAHLPVREQEEAVGHAVRAVYLYSGMADLARLNHDESLWDACETLWNNMANQKLYITGGIGGTHVGESFSYPYDLPNDTAYAETCASIGLIFWARRMLQMNPDSKYADVMERALYNGVLSGMSLDGKSFFYVNPLEVNPEACHKDERVAHVKPVRQLWFGCACCPPNLARIISSIQTYAYTANENTLWVHLYMGGSVRTMIHGVERAIKIDSCNAHTESIKTDKSCITIDMREVEGEYTIALRIPDWSCAYHLDLSSDIEQYEQQGYLYLTGDWSEIDSFTISFKMETRIYRSNLAVRENLGQVAVVRGPIVYCLEEVDNGSDLHQITISDGDFTEIPMEIQGESVVGLQTQGERLVEAQEQLYSIYKPLETEEVTLRFIPYYTWANRGENEMRVWVDIEK